MKHIKDFFGKLWRWLSAPEVDLKRFEELESKKVRRG